MKKALGVLAATVVTPLSIGVAFLLLGVARLGWFADKEWRLILVNVLMYSYVAVPISLAVSGVMGLPVAGYLPGVVAPERRIFCSPARSWVLFHS